MGSPPHWLAELVTAHTGPGGPAGDLVFDHARIRARAAELDLGPDVFARQTGVSLGELARLGPTRVSVAQLARIAAVLDLPLDDLLTTTPPAVTDPPEPTLTPRVGDPRDDQLVEALLLRFGRFALDELAGVLGWTHTRTHTAVTALQQRWGDDTALRISGTADDLEVGLRAWMLPTAVQARIIARRHARTPLTPSEAGNLLRLIRAELLRPVNPDTGPNTLLAVYAGNSLIERGLAHRAPNPAGLAVSPDLMFALGLVNQPDQPPDRQRSTNPSLDE